MESIHFGRWQVNFDPESTRKAYAAVSMGGPEECGCEPCLNFAAARDQIYVPQLVALLEKLGISPHREVEIDHMARLKSADTCAEAGIISSVRSFRALTRPSKSRRMSGSQILRKQVSISVWDSARVSDLFENHLRAFPSYSLSSPPKCLGFSRPENLVRWVP